MKCSILLLRVFFQDYYEANDGKLVFLELLEPSKLELLFSTHSAYNSRNSQWKIKHITSAMIIIFVLTSSICNSFLYIFRD